MDIKIRFNTDKDKVDKSLFPWRVIINNVEFLAEKVTIQTKSWTTLDEVSPGILKWHITCAGDVQWDDQQKECTIV